MAKGEQRGNREAKKPKKEKPKAAPAASPFAKQDTGATPRPEGHRKEVAGLRSRLHSFSASRRWPTGRWPGVSRRFMINCTNRSRAEQTSVAIYPEVTRINGSVSLKATFQ